jgi:hypothetical protein
MKFIVHVHQMFFACFMTKHLDLRAVAASFPQLTSSELLLTHGCGSSRNFLTVSVSAVFSSYTSKQHGLVSISPHPSRTLLSY